MKHTHVFTGVLCALSTLTCNLSHANPDVTSREYKLLLNPANFSYDSEAAQVDSYFTAFKAAVEPAIARSVSGAMALSKVRTVKFYDTAGGCPLSQLGYVFRERIENGNSEVTLKFRSPDRYIADFEDVSSPTSGAETKLESDIGVKGTDTFKVVYGHSTTAPNTRNINEFQDIHSHFPGFAAEYGFSDNQPLDLVGNLTIHEQVYKGGIIDLGSIDAELSVTLWYTGTPSGSAVPFIAEASFKYVDPTAGYTQKVVQRAKTSFASMQTLSGWNATGSTSKTLSVYQYDAGFCY